MQYTQRPYLILILGLLSALGPFSIDMYLPGFPAIATNLHTTVDQVAYSLSSFFVGICLGQLICGPLLDRFGRKTPLLVGLVLYVLASVGCATAVSVEALVAFRFVQALGGCVGMVTPNAIVRDVFPVEKSARVFSMLILILGVSPILAPTVGSYIVKAWGWQEVFVVLAVVAMLLFGTVLKWLPETKGPDPHYSLAPRAIVRGFASVFKERQFLIYALSGAVASAGLFAYLAGSPFVFMQLFKVSEQRYGLIFAIIAGGLIGSSQINSLLLKYYTSRQILRVVLFAQSLTGAVLLVGTLLGLLGLCSTIVLMTLFLSCQGFTFPNAAALAMAPFSKGAGSASALMGALQMALGALASALVGLFFDGTAVPMVAVMACCCTSGFLILLLGSRRLTYQAEAQVAREQALEMIEKY